MNEVLDRPLSVPGIDGYNDFINQKIERLLEGENLRVLDLFSGCGGLSLGFSKAGYKVIAGIELDEEAAESHAINFHKDDPFFSQHARSRDIQVTDPEQLLKEIGLVGNPKAQVDVIIGGPPCQAFTRIGRAKLRETFSNQHAFLKDPRSQLYKQYLSYVKSLAPMAILMENVPDMLNYGGVNIAELVCDDLNELGFKCQYTLLNSAHYGVPQMRERMFLIAIHSSVNADILFPAPTHFIELPKGYHGSRNVALKYILSEETTARHYTAPPEPTAALPGAYSASDALSDLPLLTEHLENKMKRGAKKLDTPLPYSRLPQNGYQTLMRNWPGLPVVNTVCSNVIRFLPRDYPIFERMEPGDQYPEAIEVANILLTQKIRKEEKARGKPISKRSKKYEKLLKETIPPYDVSKFPNKWRKMEEDQPSRTLMAHLGKDSYSHIHYDSNQARTISVREAARLQSFPDGFKFAGAMNAAFRQIGNAVPPLMATSIAEAIRFTIETGIRCYRKRNLNT
ncbi:DNA cytosine methyltransferase [Chitinophaga niabensis]|uniref:DNA cytosine methyltransferase n=1 Tax=Chitinophaga niabensis TaxID=536979 RepID=UPI0031B9F978